MNNQQMWVGLGVIFVAFLIESIPSFEQNILIPATLNHPHLVVLIEAIVGCVAVWIAGRKPTVVEPRR